MVIPQSTVPLTYKGKYYYRSGSTLQELGGTALSDFIIRKMNLTWDSTLIPSATLDDIDSDAIDYFKQAATHTKRLPIELLSSSKEKVLKSLHLMNDDNQLTIAALLLFGKDIQKWNITSCFRIGRFKDDSADLLFQDSIACPLILMPNRVIEVLVNKYLTTPIRYEGLHRIEDLEIPEEALREMLCNSIVHKDYLGPFIQMKIWNDHISLWNPGTLPNNFTIETLMKEHDSRPRNKLIAQVFYFAGLIESWGRGYNKIFSEFQQLNLKIPTFREHCGGIEAAILRERLSQTGIPNVHKDVHKDVHKNVTDRQSLILNMIDANAHIGRLEMSTKLGVSERTIRRDIEILTLKGLIVRIGGRKEGHWEIVKK